MRTLRRIDDLDFGPARSFAACMAVAGLLGASLVFPPPRAAAVDAYGVDAASISPDHATAVGLTGTDVVTVSVTAHDSQSDGVGGSCMDGGLLNGRVLAFLSRPGGGENDRAIVYLNRVGSPGSPAQSGTWTGPWRVGSTRSGTWTIDFVYWCHAGLDGTADYRTASPPTAASVTVVGSAPPTVSAFARVPEVVAWGQRQWMVATYRDAAGHPLAGRPVTVGDQEGSCGWYANGNRLQTTDTRGRLALRLVWAWPRIYPNSLCAYLANPQLVDLGRFDASTLLNAWDPGLPSRYEYYKLVSATPSASAMRSGHSVTVQGNAFPAVGTASLQRLVGRTWRTVSTARVRPSGRYTLTATPLMGLNYLRVLVHDKPWESLAPTTSRVVVLTGTVR